MGFRKILCATDFSPGAQAAVATAAWLAKRSNCELLLVHVASVVASSGLYSLPPETISRIFGMARSELERERRDAVLLGAPTVSTRLIAGTAWSAIVDLAADEPEIDLVVLGTHGRTGLSRVMLGSVAEKIVRHATCSVLTVKAGYRPDGFDHVLIPIDFSELSRAAAEMAAELAPNAKLTLAHVIDMQETAITPELETRVEEELARWCDRLHATAKARTRSGRAGAELLAMVDEEPYDLVVVGTHGRTGLRRLVLGSVAEKLVRYAPGPVLVVRGRTSSPFVVGMVAA